LSHVYFYAVAPICRMRYMQVEPAISKIKSLRFATEAAITILRIDDMIKLAPPEQRQGGR